MLRRAAAFIAACLLLGVGASAAGTADDSLVTVSAARAWADGLLEELTRELPAGTASSGARSVTLAAGERLSLQPGASAAVISGEAYVTVRGTVVNATRGALAVSGRLNAGELYIVGADAPAVLSTGAGARALVWGRTQESAAAAEFEDVPEGAWYYDYVYAAVDAGLINGMSAAVFSPESGFTTAQAVKIAACLHQLTHEGAVTLTNGEVWYESYLGYAIENGVAPESWASLDDAGLNEPITRLGFAQLFYNAMPGSELEPVRTVESIPDVPAGSEGAEAVYALYAAGILEGATADGMYLPESGIRRSEIAAITARLIIPAWRISE